MKHMTLQRIAEACRGVYHGPEELLEKEISSITIDSREVEKGALFVPIVGVHADGHSFIEQVMEKGAMVTLSERELGSRPYPYIRVMSCLRAVRYIAEAYLKELKIPVVGVTGSVGKTSTKEVIAAVLARKFRVLKTQGNHNNELGLPLTVFSLREEDEIAVLEMGISNFGEMTRLARIARPDVGVITNIGWCHLENLKSREGVFQAKTELLEWIKPEGRIILNGDDDMLCRVEECRGLKPVFFGLNPDFPVWADHVEGMGLKGIRCRIHAGGQEQDLAIPLPGLHMVYNALAGTAVGLAFGMDLAEIRRGIEGLQAMGGRFHILECGGMTVVDDCYNASPVSMKASLEMLQDGSGRRVAILGDMGELGDDEVELHEEVGRFAGRQKIEALYTVGPLCRYLAEAARKENPGLLVEHYAALKDFLPLVSRKTGRGDTVLVKASHFMEFGQIVEKLTGKKEQL